MTRPVGDEEARSSFNKALAPNPEEVNEFHRYDDLDNSPESHHHTLGPDPNQSSPGDHNHDGRNSSIISADDHTHPDQDYQILGPGTSGSFSLSTVVLQEVTRDFEAGLYLLKARIFITAFAPGTLRIYANGGERDLVGTHDAGGMTPQFFNLDGLYYHAGGSLEVSFQGATESGTVNYGYASDPRWGPKLTVARISN